MGAYPKQHGPLVKTPCYDATVGVDLHASDVESKRRFPNRAEHLIDDTAPCRIPRTGRPLEDAVFHSQVRRCHPIMEAFAKYRGYRPLHFYQLVREIGSKREPGQQRKNLQLPWSWSARRKTLRCKQVSGPIQVRVDEILIEPRAVSDGLVIFFETGVCDRAVQTTSPAARSIATTSLPDSMS